MGNTLNAYGKPVISATPTQTVADMQAVADFADKYALVRADADSVRTGLTPGQIKDGMLFPETNTGDVYQRRLGNWVKVLSDTGWVNLGTYNTGWTTEGTDTPQYRVLNNVLYFRGRIDATSGAGNLPFVNALPVSARPSRDTAMRLGVTSSSASTHFIIAISASGVLTVFKTGIAVDDLALAGIAGIPLG